MELKIHASLVFFCTVQSLKNVSVFEICSEQLCSSRTLLLMLSPLERDENDLSV